MSHMSIAIEIHSEHFLHNVQMFKAFSAFYHRPLSTLCIVIRTCGTCLYAHVHKYQMHQ